VSKNYAEQELSSIEPYNDLLFNQKGGHFRFKIQSIDKKNFLYSI
jgi:hypothetical protein